MENKEIKEKAHELVEFAKSISVKDAEKIVDKITEEIIMALYDYKIREPQEWYDIQEETSDIFKNKSTL